MNLGINADASANLSSSGLNASLDIDIELPKVDISVPEVSAEASLSNSITATAASSTTETSESSTSTSSDPAPSGDQAENVYIVSPGDDGWTEPKSVPTGQPTRFIITKKSSHVVRLIGLIFDANKCFLLPYALPGIKALVDMHKKFENAEILIVGHDGSDEDFAGVEIARYRAQMIADYLTNKEDAWLAWFGADKPAKVRWGTREIQLMLSALPQGAKPCFLGNASGVSNQKTKDAVKAFQQYWNTNKGTALKVDGIAGPKTQKELVTAYMEIENTTLTQNIKPVVHGCEGQFEDDLTLQGMQPDERIIEVFFFEKGIKPVPAGKTSRTGSTDYFEWKKQVIETKNFEYHGIHVQVIDKNKKPVTSAQVVLEGPITCKSFTDDQGFAFFSGLVAGTYTVRAEKKGIEISTGKITYPTAKTLSRKK